MQEYDYMTDFNPPVSKPEADLLYCPKSDSYKPLIDSWLEEDKKALRK